ncbi:alpha-glucan family phosphorylase [Candidatus Collierbacteria bacterium]|nr:alpha-glucan family phosphorylase [Candidatus Collierbacteria bacterium]
MDPFRQWFNDFNTSDLYRQLQLRPVAYFCAEFCLYDRTIYETGPQMRRDLPIYAGGLGILSGDVIREAADRNFPLVGVGLFYSDSRDLGVAQRRLKMVLDNHRNLIIVKIPLQDRHIYVAAYVWQEKGVPIYLLTTDISLNEPRDRAITSTLYPGDKEKRLQQEIVLGLGGLRFLEVLGIHPAVYHLNEGHSAFLAIEIIRHEIEERLIPFDQAQALAKRRIVFTNHTLLPGGNDVFSNDLIAANLAKLGEEMMVPVNELVKLGLIQESSLFSMTILSLRSAQTANAVSQFHAKKAIEIWPDHPMNSITNGIHLSTWDRTGVGNELDWFGQESDIRDRHKENKRKLLSYVEKVSGLKWSENVLLAGWGRRIAGYKRPQAIFQEVDRLAGIFRDKDRPVRLVISGTPHPADEDGQREIIEIGEIIKTKLSDVACYLKGYNFEIAGAMTAGCDLWLNTPAVGFEACGTSTMKAMLNGNLLVSTRDGWLDEIEINNVGWELNDADPGADFLGVLDREIRPQYYAVNNSDPADKWLQKMRQGREIIAYRYSTSRMLKEYVEKLYAPIISMG